VSDCQLFIATNIFGFASFEISMQRAYSSPFNDTMTWPLVFSRLAASVDEPLLLFPSGSFGDNESFITTGRRFVGDVSTVSIARHRPSLMI